MRNRHRSPQGSQAQTGQHVSNSMSRLRRPSQNQRPQEARTKPPLCPRQRVRHRATARRQPEQPPGDKLPQVNPDAVMRALSHPATPGSAQPATPPAGGSTATEASEASQRPTLQPDVDPPKHPAAVREIRLELSGNDQRVEVKLSDRAGELQVAVRTGDSQLADRLRENLPALSSRLEQGGMRAETWHPAAAAAGDWRQTEETVDGIRRPAGYALATSGTRAGARTRSATPACPGRRPTIQRERQGLRMVPVHNALRNPIHSVFTPRIVPKTIRTQTSAQPTGAAASTGTGGTTVTTIAPCRRRTQPLPVRPPTPPTRRLTSRRSSAVMSVPLLRTRQHRRHLPHLRIPRSSRFSGQARTSPIPEGSHPTASPTATTRPISRPAPRRRNSPRCTEAR